MITSLRDPYYANSAWMVLASLASAGAGFLFWIIAAKLYPSDEVGLASALISAGLLIVSIARLGLEQAVIRFFPERDQSVVYTTVLAVIVAASAAVTASFYFLVEAVAPSLVLVRDSFIVFFVFVVTSSVLSLTGVVFVAKKRSKFFFLQSALHAARLLFLPLLVAFGTVGILGSMAAATVLTAGLSALVVSAMGVHVSRVDARFLRGSLGFSTSNYLAGLLMMAPGLLLPIVALNALGTSGAAYYYMAYSIASFLFLVPTALSTSMFVEGSHGAELSAIARKAVRASLLSLSVLVVAMVALGHFLLAFIGPQYAQAGFALLVIFSISSFPIALVQVAFSTLLVRKDLRGMVVLGLVQFTAVLSGAIALVGPYGLEGIGLGWLLGNAVAAVVSAAIVLGRAGAIGPTRN